MKSPETADLTRSDLRIRARSVFTRAEIIDDNECLDSESSATGPPALRIERPVSGTLASEIPERRLLAQAGAGTDIADRIAVFTKALGQYLLALGHSAVVDRGVSDLRLDGGQYEPYLGHRRLRALGSGSDPARLVGAYTLALAAAGVTLKGLHPGVVILDEPLQQNPDTRHLELFLDFLSQDLAKNAKFQTLVFTFLNEDEVHQLRESGTTVITVDGHLLGPVPPLPIPEHPPSPETAEKPPQD